MKLHDMQATRSMRKTLDQVASHNEDAALLLMRAAERIGDELFRQQLLKVVHDLNCDADELRALRDALELRRA